MENLLPIIDDGNEHVMRDITQADLAVARRVLCQLYLNLNLNLKD
jgi:hypothetical protein